MTDATTSIYALEKETTWLDRFGQNPYVIVLEQNQYPESPRSEMKRK